MRTAEREQELRDRLAELKRQRFVLIAAIRNEASKALTNSYDFAFPNLNLYAQVIQIESGIRELDYVVNTLGGRA